MRKFVNLAMYASLCLVWGSTWLFIKVGYGGLGPFNVAVGAVRILTGVGLAVTGSAGPPRPPFAGASAPALRT